MTAHRTCVLAYDGLCLFEFAMAVEVLEAATDHNGHACYDVTIAALDRSPVRGVGGVSVKAAAGLEALGHADTVIVPGWRTSPVPPRLLAALLAAHGRGARLASICTGAFVLAAAGLLDGRRATTHWKFARELAEAHPLIEVDADVLYVDDGDVVTSAGSAAGIDMLLHLVRRDFGARVSNSVARSLVIPPHREGGQAQYVERPISAVRKTAFSHVLEHVRQNPTAEHRIERLAGMAAMTPRTFYRRFKAATGCTPYEWLVQERVEVAKALLEETPLSIEEVAVKAGFGAADTLRHHFRRMAGTTPQDFRHTFRDGSVRPNAPAGKELRAVREQGSSKEAR